MFALPKQPQNVFKLLLTSLKFWKAYIGDLLLVILVTAIIGTIPAFFVPKRALGIHDLTLKFTLKHWAFVLLFFIVMFYLFAFVALRIYALMYQNKTPMLNSFCVALKKLPYLIAAVFIYEITVFIGMLFFVIPGIGLAILLSMYFILIVIEDKNLISGFKSSWLMVTENWWHAFVTILILTMIVFIMTLAVGELSAGMWVMVHPSSQGQLDLGTRIVRILADMIFYPFYVTVMMMLYHDLKLRNAQKDKSIDVSPEA